MASLNELEKKLLLWKHRRDLTFELSTCGELVRVHIWNGDESNLIWMSNLADPTYVYYSVCDFMAGWIECRAALGFLP